MTKQASLLLGITLSLTIILFSMPFASAISETLEFTIVRGIESRSLDFPFAVATDSKNKIFVAVPLLNNIHVYDSAGNLLSTINDSTIHPTFISIDTNNRIIVGDVFSEKVHVLDPDGNLLFNINYSFNGPARITTDTNNRIIVVDNSDNLTHIFDANGTFQFTIVPPLADEDDIPTGVATDSNNRIIVADYGNKQINIYDSLGNFEFSIDEAIPGVTSFISPLKVATDSKDRIIVMESDNVLGSGKHAIFIYNSEGIFLHTISYASFDSIRLSDIATDSNDRIIVADSAGKVVRVYSMDYGNGLDSIKKKRGCGGDCTPPTFGKDDNGRLFVQGGFSSNGDATDVIDFHTPYKMITANTNSIHNFTLKVYENYGNNNIEWFQFGIVSEVGDTLDDAEVLATIYISSSKVDKVIEEDKNNLWDIINATSYSEDCGYVTAECLELSLDIIFREELKNKVIVIQAMDNSRRTDTKFLNDGIQTVGESMNEPLISYVAASNGGAFYPQERGVVELTLTSYKDDLWQDPYGYEWTITNSGFRILDTVPAPIKEPDVMWQVMTRMHSNFADMIIYEQDRAVVIFDSSKLESVLGNSFAYDYPETFGNKLDDPELIEKLRLAEQNALTFYQRYAKN